MRKFISFLLLLLKITTNLNGLKQEKFSVFQLWSLEV